MRRILVQRKFLIYLLLALGLWGCARSPEARRDKYLNAGKNLLAKKDYGRAILELKNAIQAMPKDPEPHYQMAMAYLGRGEIASGLARLRAALDLNPRHAAAQFAMAQLLAQTDDRDLLLDAESRLRVLLNLTPHDPDALNALALTELKLGKPQDAVQHLEQALARFPKHLRSSVSLARAKLAQKDDKAAEEILKKACQLDPAAPYPLVALGRLYAYLRRDAEAEQQFRRALQLAPDNTEALLDLAMIVRHLGRKPEAEQHFKRLAGLKDKTYKPVFGLFLFDEGRIDEAIREFEALAKADPSDLMVRSRLVSAYQRAQRIQDAERVLNEALQKNPKDLEALLQRSEVFLMAGKLSQAQADLNQVLHFRTDSPEARYILSKIYQATGSTLSQRQELSEALKLKPELLLVRLELAQLLIATRAPKTALEVLDATPQPQKAEPSVLVQRNWALLAMDRLAEARQGIDQGLAWKRLPDFLIQDGLWKLKHSDFKAALVSLEEALQTNPEDVRALEAIGRVYVAQKQAPAGLQRLKDYAARRPKSAPVQHLLGAWSLAGGERAQARAAFEAAKAADSSFSASDIALADLDIAEGQLEAAQKRLAPLLAANPQNSTVRLYVADLDIKQQRYSNAVEHYRLVLQNDPSSPVALNNLAYLLANNSNQPGEALAYAQQIKEKMPNHPAVEDTIGWSLYRKGLYSAAVRELESAARKSPDPVIQYHLGMAYLQLGDKSRGQRVLKAAMASAPTLPEAQMARDLIARTNAED